jgi:hypothetical protein
MIVLRRIRVSARRSRRRCRIPRAHRVGDEGERQDTGDLRDELFGAHGREDLAEVFAEPGVELEDRLIWEVLGGGKRP